MASRNIMNMLGELAGSVLRSLLTRGSGSSAESGGSTPQPSKPRSPSSSGTAKRAPGRSASRPAERSGARGTTGPRAGAGEQTGSVAGPSEAELQRREAMLQGEPSPGQFGPCGTVEVTPPPSGALVVRYAPQHDGAPDAGEVVWTWIPYEERDGRGKDRPVLVIANAADDWTYAVRLTSESHDGDRDFLSIGSGSWDSRGRESWVDVEQLYLVHASGMRREASTLDRPRFEAVAAALQARYGWRAA